MNPFELEQFISRLEEEESQSGGKVKVDIEDPVKDKTLKITTHTTGPKFTRPILSIYEYACILTTLAKYLDNQTELTEYLPPSTELQDFINPSFLAFELLERGKVNAILTRNGEEQFSLQELYIKPEWKNMIRDYISTKRELMKKELLHQQILNEDKQS